MAVPKMLQIFLVLFFALSGLSSGAAAAKEVDPAALLERVWSYRPELPRHVLDQAISYQGNAQRLERFLWKLITGRPVKVVFTGGSISVRGFHPDTPDVSFAKQLHKWLEVTFVEGCAEEVRQRLARRNLLTQQHQQQHNGTAAAGAGGSAGSRRLQGGEGAGGDTEADPILAGGPHTGSDKAYLRSGHMCGGSNIELVHLAVPAAGPAYLERCVLHNVPEDADLVVVDLATNDYMNGELFSHPERQAYERIVRKALALPRKPAVLQFASYSFGQARGTFAGTFPNPQGVLNNVGLLAEDKHLVMAQYYGEVQVLSVRSALWQVMAASEDARFRLIYTNDLLHVNDKGHRWYSDLIVNYLQQQTSRLLLQHIAQAALAQQLQRPQVAALLAARMPLPGAPLPKWPADTALYGDAEDSAGGYGDDDASQGDDTDDGEGDGSPADGDSDEEVDGAEAQGPKQAPEDVDDGAERRRRKMSSRRSRRLAAAGDAAATAAGDAGDGDAGAAGSGSAISIKRLGGSSSSRALAAEADAATAAAPSGSVLAAAAPGAAGAAASWSDPWRGSCAVLGLFRATYSAYPVTCGPEVGPGLKAPLFAGNSLQGLGVCSVGTDMQRLVLEPGGWTLEDEVKGGLHKYSMVSEKPGDTMVLALPQPSQTTTSSTASGGQRRGRANDDSDDGEGEAVVVVGSTAAAELAVGMDERLKAELPENTLQGTLIYLKSYHDLGTAELSCAGGCSCRSYILQGLDQKQHINASTPYMHPFRITLRPPTGSTGSTGSSSAERSKGEDPEAEGVASEGEDLDDGEEGEGGDDSGERRLARRSRRRQRQLLARAAGALAAAAPGSRRQLRAGGAAGSSSSSTREVAAFEVLPAAAALPDHPRSSGAASGGITAAVARQLRDLRAATAKAKAAAAAADHDDADDGEGGAAASDEADPSLCLVKVRVREETKSGSHKFKVIGVITSRSKLGYQHVDDIIRRFDHQMGTGDNAEGK